LGGANPKAYTRLTTHKMLKVTFLNWFVFMPHSDPAINPISSVSPVSSVETSLVGRKRKGVIR
jgi:hypothetical protein